MVEEGLMAEKEQNYMAWLQEKGQIKERPFTSNVPLLGPLIVRFRSAWHSMAAKWVMRPLIQQQNEFNAMLVQQMSEFENQIMTQVIEQDREQTALIREMAELDIQLKQMIRLLEDINGRLEESSGSSGELEEE